LFAGPPPTGFLPAALSLLFFRCTLVDVLIDKAARSAVVFFLQPFRGRLCRGTPEPHPWLSGPARRPGFRSCWGRAGPDFSVGAPVAGRTRAGPRPARSGPASRCGHGASGPGFRRWTSGRLRGVPSPDHGMLGSARTARLFPPSRVTLLGPIIHCLRVCPHRGNAPWHCQCCRTAVAPRPRARASGPGRADGTTPRRRPSRARLAGSLMAPRRFAALGLRPPLPRLRRSVLARTCQAGPGSSCRPHHDRRPEPQA
jgi:hypothetical protein